MSDNSYITLKKTELITDIWTRGKPLLNHIDIELTERCNNNCVHCSIRQPGNSHHFKKSELSTEKILSILSEAVSIGLLSVRFTGGEPLLREDFAEIYESARRMGLKVSIFTNARLITPNIVNLFKKIPPLGRIEITAYGMSEKSYALTTRAKGAYREFLRGVELLLSNNIAFVVRGVLLPHLLEEIEDFEMWARKIPYMDQPPAISTLFSLRDRRDSFYRNTLIKKIRLRPQQYLAIIHRRPAYKKELALFYSRFTQPVGDQIFRCASGHTPCIDSSGNLQMCLPLRHPDTIYPLNKGTLKDAIESFFPKIRSIKAVNKNFIERCARCFLAGLCEQCPAKSWAEHGTLDTPVEYFCEIAHAIAEDIGLLEKGEKGWNVPNWEERVANLVHKLL